MRATAGGFFQRPQRPPRGGSRFDDDEGGGGGGVTVMGSKQAVEAKLRAGRTSGVYNLACLELTTVPPAAVDPWNPAHLRPGENDKAWEVVEPTKVDLSMNELEALPAEMGGWAPSLRALLCRQNRLARLPPALFSLSSLVTLDLSSNALVAFGDGDLLAGLAALRELHLRANNLTELPASFGALAALETLDVSANKLTTLPPSIGQLTRLVSFTAHQNALQTLPPGLLALPALRLLDVRKNKLQEADGRPLDFSRLVAATFVDLRENQLAFPPSPLPPQGAAISQFYLGNNRIRRLPADAATWFAGLAGALTELDLQGNGLEELPVEVGLCQRLKLMNVQNNDLRDVPFTLGYLSDLNRVSIEGNPLRTLRRSLFSAPISELKAFLRTRGDPPAWLLALEDGKDPLALAAEMGGLRMTGGLPHPRPAAAPTATKTTARIAPEEQQQPQQPPLPHPPVVDPPLPSVSAFVSPPLPPPPSAHTHAAADARQPLPPPPGGSGSTGNTAVAGPSGVGGDAAAALDEAIARLEAELDALGLTKQREMLLKKELAMKRAERARRRASLG